MAVVTRFSLTPPTFTTQSVSHRYKRITFFGTQAGVAGFFVVTCGAVDGTHIKVVFSNPAVASEALQSTNYTANLGLAITGVVQETTWSYILTTSPQSPGVQYILTLAGIHDLNGNSI